MVNSRKLYTILILLVLFSSSILSAQSTKFKQKLSWVEDKNAFDYKVEIRGVETSYKSLLESDTSFVEVSLPAGKYRYRVYAFDFLGRQASVSDWRDFTVLKAVQPQVVNKEKTVVPVKDDNKVSIPVDVKSIEEDSKVELVNKETNQVVEGKLDVKVDDKNQLVASEAVFPMVEEGNWVVKVTNPSGLFTESEEIKVETNVARQQLEAERKAEKDRIAAERRAEEERIAAEEERLAVERKAKEERIAAERRAEEERIAAEEERLAVERKAEEERLAQARKVEQERLEAERKAEEESLAAERKAEEERLAQARKVEQERLEAERKAEEEQQAAEEKLTKAEVKKNKTAADFSMLVGGGALINIYDGSLLKYNNQTLWKKETDSSVLPEVNVRMAYLPVKFDGWKTGVELAAQTSILYFENEYIQSYLPFTVVELNCEIQRKLGTDKFLLALKLGGSASIINEIAKYKQDTEEERQASEAAFVNWGAQTGLSFVFIPVKNFEIELGCDFNHVFIPEMPTGNINTYLVMGVRL
ncbi:MAG: hypothetical protein MR958_07275 [Spirochaetia bacterium]|nr:hypothetical protein [Spirochaetia bacterium]